MSPLTCNRKNEKLCNQLKQYLTFILLQGIFELEHNYSSVTDEKEMSGYCRLVNRSRRRFEV